jgi:hypothetical protein
MSRTCSRSTLRHKDLDLSQRGNENSELKTGTSDGAAPVEIAVISFFEIRWICAKDGHTTWHLLRTPYPKGRPYL